MSLTPEGRRLLDYADRLLALADEAEADVGDGSPRGRLRIGAMESTAAVHLPRLLSTLHARHPALEIQLVTATSGVLVSQVRSGELSAAFVGGDVREPGLAADPAFVEELVLITHPSARRPAAVELRERTLVTFGSGCTYRACVHTWLAGQGLRPPRVFEVASYHTMLACVAANVGYAVAPRSVLLASSARRAVRAHRLGPRPWRITTHLVRRVPTARAPSRRFARCWLAGSYGPVRITGSYHSRRSRAPRALLKTARAPRLAFRTCEKRRALLEFPHILPLVTPIEPRSRLYIQWPSAIH
jgi:DNA-binding transcriptional LysR family regulator